MGLNWMLGMWDEGTARWKDEVKKERKGREDAGIDWDSALRWIHMAWGGGQAAKSGDVRMGEGRRSEEEASAEIEDSFLFGVV